MYVFRSTQHGPSWLRPFTFDAASGNALICSNDIKFIRICFAEVVKRNWKISYFRQERIASFSTYLCKKIQTYIHRDIH